MTDARLVIVSLPCQKVRADSVCATCANNTHLFRRFRIIFLSESMATVIECFLSFDAAMSIEMAIEPGILFMFTTQRLRIDISSCFLNLL